MKPARRRRTPKLEIQISPELGLALLAATYGIYILWAFHYPVGCDFPQHLAQAVLWKFIDLKYHGADQIYYRNWFTPYVGGYALVRALLIFLPGLAALKLFLSLTLLFYIYGFHRLAEAFKAPPAIMIFAPPFFFGFSYFWGFLNYLLGIPVALLVLSYFKEVLDGRRPNQPLKTGLGSVVLFFSHGLALFAATVTAFAMAATAKKPFWKRVLYFAPWTIGVILSFAWSAYMKRTEPAASYGTRWNLGIWRLQNFFQSFTMDVDFGKAMGTAVVLLLSFLVLFRLRPLNRANAANWAFFATTAALFFLLPEYCFGTALVAQRFSCFLLAGIFVLFQSANPLLRRPWIAGLCFLLSLLWLGSAQKLSAGFNQELEGFTKIAQAVPENTTLCNEMGDRSSPHVATQIYDQIAAWVQSEKGGEVNFSFASHHPELVRYKKWRPHASFDLEECRYAFYRTVAHPAFLEFKESHPFTVVAQSGNWVLEKRDAPPPNP